MKALLLHVCLLAIKATASDVFINVCQELELGSKTSKEAKLQVPRKRPGRRPSFIPSSQSWTQECVRRAPLSSYECPNDENEEEDDDQNLEDLFGDYESGYHESYSSRCGEDGCCDEEPVTRWIEDMDFYHTYPVMEGGRKNWHYISFGNFTANGGILVTGKMGGYLDSHQYTVSAGQTAIPELDHLKYTIFSDKIAPVPGRGKLVIEWKASAETFKTALNPFGDSVVLPNDPRLASAGFMSGDPESGLVFNFLLTNDRVYVMYTRQPYLRLLLSKPFAAFTYMIPVKVRSCSEIHRLRIEFDDSSKSVTWYVDYRQVFRLDTVGSKLKNKTYLTGDYGGYSDESFPKKIEYGFGSFTFLDQYPTCQRSTDPDCPDCIYPANRLGLVKLGDETEVFPQYNPQLGMPAPAEYWDASGALENRLWGQGSETRIYQLSVYQILDGC